jgi:pyruvate/2-oxoacid:ferredoxin oxidoreductase beta subunit
MTQESKKRSRIFNYFSDNQDQFSGGVAWCGGCTMELTIRLVPKILGKDIVLVGCPSCSATVLFGQNLGAWHNLTYYSCLMTGVASSATGISRYLRRTGKDNPVVCFTGDGCAADIGFQPLSGAAERNEHVIYICYDNEGYMNTGYQRSSTTPLGASTSTTPFGRVSQGKPTPAKNVPLLLALHEVPYVATATLSNIEDFAKKLLKAKEKLKEGFSYIHVFSPCVMGWRFDSSLSIEVCRTAVRTNYFPLWEAENGKFRLTQEINNPKPIGELTKMLRKFSHLKEDDLSRLQQIVDKRYLRLKSLCSIDK